MILTTLALAATLSASTAQDTISVHEWGVVVYRNDSAIAKGTSGGPWYNLQETVTYAPVLYFYGPDFTGKVTVCSLGRIFNPWPEPDLAGGPLWNGGGLGSCVQWSISASSDDGSEQDYWRSVGSDVPGFDWAVQYWRVPGSLIVSRASDSYLDRFLYYEVDFSDVGFPLTLGSLAPEGTPEEDMVGGRVLLFHRTSPSVMSFSVLAADSIDIYMDEDHPAEVSYSCSQVTGMLMEWSSGILTEDEARAMWSTWEPYVLYGDWEGDYLVLFPLPESLVGKISILRLENDQGYPVDYRRFFLGLLTE
jgi:hypothetical protein